MMAYIMACPVEINGFGFVRTENRQVVYIEDVFILDQIASAADVETDPTALDRFILELIRAGGNPGDIKFQWHSHVQMDTFFSVTDRLNVENWQGDWLISLVANQRGEFKCRFDFLRPVRTGFEVTPRIITQVPEGLGETVAAEVRQKVRQRNSFGLKRPASDGRFDHAELIVPHSALEA
jgi:proteasome lid subunit RPN8/RPN11